MSFQIEVFLWAYRPRFICLPCLVTVTERNVSEIQGVVDSLVDQGRAETLIAECFNCNVMALSIRTAERLVLSLRRNRSVLEDRREVFDRAWRLSRPPATPSP